MKLHSLLRLPVLLVLLPALSFATSAKEWIGQGDKLYSSRGELAHNQAALQAYENALHEDPASFEALWKASRAAWWTGTELKVRSERLDVFNRGIALGQKAVQVHPDAVEGHFWLGSNYASYGNTKGAWTSLMLIHRIRAEMEQVLRLDPRYLAGGADRILGILDYKVPGMMGGDKARGLRHLQASLDVDPQNPVTTYYLAECYDSLGEKDKARDMLQRMHALKPSPDFQIEFGLIQDKVQALDRELK